MESLGLNKLTKCFKAGPLTEKINWSIRWETGNSKITAHKIYYFFSANCL